MYTVKYKPLNKYITRYLPPYMIKDRLRHSSDYFIKRMFTTELNRARKYTNLGHVKSSIGTNVSNEVWEIVELKVELK